MPRFVSRLPPVTTMILLGGSLPVLVMTSGVIYQLACHTPLSWLDYGSGVAGILLAMGGGHGVAAWGGNFGNSYGGGEFGGGYMPPSMPPNFQPQTGAPLAGQVPPVAPYKPGDPMGTNQ